jgi:hypothetical protein
MITGKTYIDNTAQPHWWRRASISGSVSLDIDGGKEISLDILTAQNRASIIVRVPLKDRQFLSS